MLTFEPIAHHYRWDGKLVEGVTDTLDSVINWDKVPEGLMLAARERGTAVHALCQAIDEGTLEDWQVPLTLEPYVRAYRAFLVDFVPRWQAIEERVYHVTYHYAGTLDRRGWFPTVISPVERAHYALVDIKTGEDHPSYALQLSAYAEAHMRCDLEVPARYVLLLRADGTYRLREIKTRHRDDFAVFLSLLNVARWKAKNAA